MTSSARLGLLAGGVGVAVAIVAASRIWPPGQSRAASSLVVEASATATDSSQRGPTSAPAPQVRGVSAGHRLGQTFVTWRELDQPPKDDLTMAEFSALRKSLADERRIRYRIYRAARPIQSISDATLVGEVQPLSAWDGENFGVSPPADAHPPRFVIAEGQPALPSGTGVYVFNPPRAEQAYYAVTASVAGAESTDISRENMTGPLTETVGTGAPVLQRTETPAQFQYVPSPTLRFYTRWETEANSNIAGRPFDYLVAVPANAPKPAPVGIHMHCWGASMRDCFGWWYNAAKGAVFVSSNEMPYDWWTGYHELLGKRPIESAADAGRGVVRPYTQRRMLAFVDWLATSMPLDLTRLFAAGSSMGGSGAIMLALREPSRIAWTISWVGLHVPAESPQFKSSYEAVYGRPEWNVKFENGTPVWDYFNDVWYLKHNPEKDVGFITFSNGKNDSSIGWAQAVEFLRALQEARQPHMFIWGQDGHGQRARMPVDGSEREMPLDLRTNQSLPAFTHSSLDDDLGNGTEASGAAAGQVNAYLFWKPESIVDEPDRWVVEIGAVQSAPQPAATVDVTPRRLQKFKLRAGDRVAWTVTAGRAVAQSGEVVADQWGLVTVPRVQISRSLSTLTLTRK